MLYRMVGALALLAIVCVGTVSDAPAYEKFQIRALGNFGNQLQSTRIERPFFEQLPKASDGRIGVTFRTMDEVGLKGFDGIRLLKLGIFDVMAMQLGYVSGDEPFVLGIDLPGVAPELQTARKVVDAYRDVFDKRMQEKYNGKTLALWPYPGQMFFCKEKIAGLADLKGKKIRVFTPAMAALVENLGATGVTLAFPEVYQALQRGVVDCAITGSISGNTAKWHEVTSYFYPASIGWAIQAHIANADFWNKLEPEARAFLEAQFKKMEDDLWALADETTQEGVYCNTNTGPCQSGTVGKMELVPVTDADRQRLKEVAQQVVVPKWAADCNKVYARCSAVWNDTIGQVVGISLR